MGRITQTPGAVSANVATNFPTGTPPLRSLRAVNRVRVTEGTPNTLVSTSVTVVTVTPSSGEAQLVGTGQWELGDAVLVTDYFEFDVEERGSVIRA